MSPCCSPEPTRGTAARTCLTPGAEHLCLGRAPRKPAFLAGVGGWGGHGVGPGAQARPVGALHSCGRVGCQRMGASGGQGKLQGRNGFCGCWSARVLSPPPPSLPFPFLCIRPPGTGSASPLSSHPQLAPGKAGGPAGCILLLGGLTHEHERLFCRPQGGYLAARFTEKALCAHLNQLCF